MYSFKSGNIIFETEKEIAWTLDGEYGGDHNRVELINDKQSIDIKVRRHEK
jgi:hypothetical protein